MGSKGAITVASLNLHCGFTQRGEPYDVTAALSSLDADVIAVQESWRATGADDDPVAASARSLGARLIRSWLHSGESLASLAIAARPDPGSFGIAIVSRLPVTGYEVVDLGRAPGDRIRRAAQVVSVLTPGGQPLRLANAHLTHKFTSPVQLAWLSRRLRQIRGAPAPGRAAAPAVIVGDLNMPRLATVTAVGYAPVIRGRTWPADRPVIQLDHMLVSQGLAGAGARVLEPVGSDHRPIRAALELS
jgi:endonuclease/exonuclease/phosphatase family metal-dependent hydrolase